MQRLLTVLLLLTTLTMSMAQKKKGTTIANDLSEQEVKDFHKQCQIKVQEFQEYLPVIADKTRSDFDRQEAFEAAERLFNAGSTIQVSSKDGKNSKMYLVGDYLNSLKDLKKNDIFPMTSDCTYTIQKTATPTIYVCKGNCKPSRQGTTFLSSVSLSIAHDGASSTNSDYWKVLIDSASIITQ